MQRCILKDFGLLARKTDQLQGILISLETLKRNENRRNHLSCFSPSGRKWISESNYQEELFPTPEIAKLGVALL